MIALSLSCMIYTFKRPFGKSNKAGGKSTLLRTNLCRS